MQPNEKICPCCGGSGLDESYSYYDTEEHLFTPDCSFCFGAGKIEIDDVSI